MNFGFLQFWIEEPVTLCYNDLIEDNTNGKKRK